MVPISLSCVHLFSFFFGKGYKSLQAQDPDEWGWVGGDWTLYFTGHR